MRDQDKGGYVTVVAQRAHMRGKSSAGAASACLQGQPSAESKAGFDACGNATDSEDALAVASVASAAPDGSVPSAASSGDAPNDSAPSDVVYSLAAIAQERPNVAVLVMVQGKAAKAVHAEAAEAGLRTCAPVTADRKLDASPRSADTTVQLGSTYSAALLHNGYAVLQAARESGSSAVLLGAGSVELAHVDSFLARAAARGVTVFRALNPTSPSLGWVLCNTSRDVPEEEEWVSCPACKLVFDAADARKKHYRCPTCAALMRMPSHDRLDAICDQGSFREWDETMPQADPLDFPGYTDKLSAQRERSGLSEAVRTGEGRIAGMPLAVGVMDSGFLMGSMGSVVGEKLSCMIDRATREGLPVVIFTASGGARMQEGLASLMQMAKVSCALERHAQAKLPYFSVLTDPTTGGVTASFAMQGDVILAEPGALIGFAGKRVIRDTIKQDLPEGFQTAEFALNHGLIDAVVPREQLREVLAHLLAIHDATSRHDAAPERVSELVGYRSVQEALAGGQGRPNRVTLSPLAFAEESGRRKRKRDDASSAGLQGVSLRKLRRALERGMFDAMGTDACDAGAGLAPAGSCGSDLWEAQSEQSRRERRQARKRAQAKGSAWESVQLARNTHRPTALRYIEGMVDGFIELHGDRAFGDDGAIVGGVGWIGGQAVTVIAQEKGASLDERIRRNFGCAQPEGYRKALRLMRQAEKFGRPIVCLVDTQGAFCGTEAEEHGQGNAIADNLIAMAGLRVPVVSVLLGEGGSGGALALAVSNCVAMQRHAVYSVLSPEGFASILWKDRKRAPEAAELMRMGADEVHALGVVDDVLEEGDGPAHENPDQAVRIVRDYVAGQLAELSKLGPDELVAQRHRRFARF